MKFLKVFFVICTFLIVYGYVREIIDKVKLSKNIKASDLDPATDYDPNDY